MKETLPLEIFYIYFSPYSAHMIEVDGAVYPTLEHAYQCLRYKDTEIIEKVKNAKSPVLAWQVSLQYKQFQVPEFKDEHYKLSVMEMLMRLKVTQHQDVKKALLESGDQVIVKHIVSVPPGDGFWDDGEDGRGLNHIGQLWMKIRNEIKTDNEKI